MNAHPLSVRLREALLEELDVLCQATIRLWDNAHEGVARIDAETPNVPRELVMIQGHVAGAITGLELAVHGWQVDFFEFRHVRLISVGFPEIGFR